MVAPCILLIDSSEPRREARARRLRSQGYAVQEAKDGATGADEALASPPAAIVAELWMPSVSGVQLCRLMKSEPATCDVPVVLCGDEDPRSRFWAERAGAAYVVNGRTGELMRALDKAIAARAQEESFFTQISDGSLGIRDRIARQLDEALFDAVIGSEIRALASAGSMDRLFDRFAQLMSQITRYRYLALAVGKHLAIHHHPLNAATVIDEARAVLGLDRNVAVSALADEDASACADGPIPSSCVVKFADTAVATFAIAPCASHAADVATLAAIVSRELGGALKITSLIEESRLAASTDTLTGLANRRAFSAWMASEMARFQRYGHPLSVLLIDVDHFKRVNDEHGHAAGDHVLAAIGDVLRFHVRNTDIAARWGGEEFIVVYTSTDTAGGATAAERLRALIESSDVRFDGKSIPVTVSVGLAGACEGESIDELVDRADKAMYESKVAGRNRLTVSRTLELVRSVG